MAKASLKTFFLIGISLLLLNCAGPKQRVAFEPMDLNPKVQSGEYIQKVDNLLIVMDVSGSMAEEYQGRVKLSWVKDLVSRLNETIPDLELKSGLRRFGMGTFAAVSPTAMIVDFSDHNQGAVTKALENITNASGDSLLDLSMEAANKDLEATQGDIALIAFTDANEMDDRPKEAAKSLMRQYGERLCIYTVLIGDDEKGRQLLKDISTISGCGFSVTGDEIYSASEMALFVEKVFLAKAGDSDLDGVLDTRDKCPDTPRGATVDPDGCPQDPDGDGVYDGLDRCVGTPKGIPVDKWGCPLDSDGDGIYDQIDQCRGTPKGVMVDSKGCPIDSDGDGVYDYLDMCTGTPKGAPVDPTGCPTDSDGDMVYDYLDKCPGTPKDAEVDERGCWVLKGVYFNTDKWEVTPDSYPVLDEVVYVLKQNPGLKVEIQGHTDNVGEAQYNRELSKKRARSVMSYLIQQGIRPARLSYEGYGFSNPAASNATPEGRAKNRRVELKPIY